MSSQDDMVDLRMPRWAARAIVADDGLRPHAWDEAKAAIKKALRPKTPSARMLNELRRQVQGGLGTTLSHEECAEFLKVAT